jgi:hypothetical protein
MASVLLVLLLQADPFLDPCGPYSEHPASVEPRVAADMAVIRAVVLAWLDHETDVSALTHERLPEYCVTVSAGDGPESDPPKALLDDLRHRGFRVRPGTKRGCGHSRLILFVHRMRWCSRERALIAAGTEDASGQSTCYYKVDEQDGGWHVNPGEWCSQHCSFGGK